MDALPPLPVISSATIIPHPAFANTLPLIYIHPTEVFELTPPQLKVVLAPSSRATNAYY